MRVLLRKKMPRSSYKVFETDYPYMVTCSTAGWLPMLSIPDAAQIILDSLKFLQNHRGLTLYAYVIMEDHLHLIAESCQLPKNMRTFKSYTARQIIDLLKKNRKSYYLEKMKQYKLPHHQDSEFQFWQEGYHPKQIIGDDIMIQKMEYIHNNPINMGYVDYPEDWKYSSASDYLGIKGLIPITLYGR